MLHYFSNYSLPTVIFRLRVFLTKKMLSINNSEGVKSALSSEIKRVKYGKIPDEKIFLIN